MVYVVYVAWSSIPKWNPSGTQMPIKGMMTIQQYGQFTPRFDRVICTSSCMCAQQHGRASHTEYGNFIIIFPGPAAGTFHPNSEVSLECLHSAHCSTSLASQIVVISKIWPSNPMLCHHFPDENHHWRIWASSRLNHVETKPACFNGHVIPNMTWEDSSNHLSCWQPNMKPREVDEANQAWIEELN